MFSILRNKIPRSLVFDISTYFEGAPQSMWILEWGIDL